MEKSDAMISSTHSFAYSYRLFKKYFVKNCETSQFHILYIFFQIFIIFSPFWLKNLTLIIELAAPASNYYGFQPR